MRREAQAYYPQSFAGKLIAFLYCTLFIVFITFSSTVSASKEIRILVLLSFDIQTPWSKAFIAGASVEATRNNRQVVLDLQLLDYSRYSSPELKDAQRSLIVEKYKNAPPDAIIAESIEAINYLQQYLRPIMQEPPVVIFNNRLPESLDIPIYTLITSESSVERTVELALKIHKPKNVYLLGDQTTDSRNVAKLARQHIPDSSKINIVSFLHLGLDEVAKKARRLPEDAIAFYTLIFHDESDDSITPVDALKIIANESSVPIYTFWETLVGSGTVGGYVVDPIKAGKQVVQSALKLIDEGKPDKPRIEAGGLRYIFDKRELMKWNIKEDSISPDAEIRYKQRNIFKEYFFEVIVGLVVIIVQGILLILLQYYSRQKKRLASELTKTNEGLEEQIHERTLDIMTAKDEAEAANIDLQHAQQKLRNRSDLLEQQVKERTQELEALSKKDPLTNLDNRLALDNALDETINNPNLINHHFIVIFIDLDGFKYVNDTFGHFFGDEVLKCLAERLVDHIDQNDILARLGGDEFIIVLNENDKDQIKRDVKEILSSINKPIHVNDRVVHITASAGISCYPDDGLYPEVLIRNADSAMYQAKRKKNTYAFYSKILTQKAKERLNLETLLRQALDEDELEVYYQPKVDMVTGEIKGSEALLRWKKEPYGMISPVKFIPLAEETGLIIPIGEFVMMSVCKDMKVLCEKDSFLGRVAVNISGVQFSNTNILKLIQSALDEAKLDANHLEIEITESALMNDPSSTNEILSSIEDLGVTIMVDDFGTGFSSLSNLKKLEITGFKIDQSFVRDINKDTKHDGAAIVNATITLAKDLELDVIAEGVENEYQKKYLIDHGCINGQGYYYSKPVTFDELRELIKEGLIIR